MHTLSAFFYGIPCARLLGFLALLGFLVQTPDHVRKNCNLCHVSFSLFIRRHHCRRCGEVFCDACSSFKWKIKGQILRVCGPCFGEDKQQSVSRALA